MIKMRSLPVNAERRFNGTDFFKALTGLIDLTLRFACRQIRRGNSIYNDFFCILCKRWGHPPPSPLVLDFGD